MPKVSRDEAAGFMKSLTDFTFTSFVSPQVLKVLYGLYLFVMGLSIFALFAVWYDALTDKDYNVDTGEMEWGPDFGVFCGSFVAYPLGLFLYITLGRVIFERGILAFRQYELTKELVELMRDKS